jgi:hypothetical protein
LLKSDSFQWNEGAQLAFKQLKQALSTSPVLALPDFSKVFVIETDASAKGLGAVPMQDSHPLAFISKGISPKQQAMSVYEELLTILMVVKHWHHYLIVKHFVIKTDQKSLKYLLDQKVSTPLQQTWLAKLLGYDYEISYKKGIDNTDAGALSRMEGLALFQMGISSINPILWLKIQASWSSNLKAQELIRKLQLGHPIKNFSWDGQIFKGKAKYILKQMHI